MVRVFRWPPSSSWKASFCEASPTHSSTSWWWNSVGFYHGLGAYEFFHGKPFQSKVHAYSALQAWTPDTCLGLEKLNPRTAPAWKAEEGRHWKHRPEGAEGEEAAWTSVDQGAREKALGTQGAEAVREENQTENSSKEQERENGNPVRAFNRSNMARSTGRGDHFSSRVLEKDQGQRRRKPVMGSVRDNQAITFPPVTCLLVRLCTTRKVQDPFFKSVNECFRKTSPCSVFTALKMVSCIHVLLGGIFFFKKKKYIKALLLSWNVFPLKAGVAKWMSYSS